jgi:tetratricopeptide (TPR) repeat protein
MNRRKAFKYYKIGRSLSQGSKDSQYFFDSSIKTDSTFSYGYFEKSVPFNKRGDYAKGFELLNKAVELNPKMHLGYRGWLRLIKLKDYKESISDLQKLKKIKSKHTYKAWGQNINFLIGISYLGMKNYVIAIEYFNFAINENSFEIDLNHHLYNAIALFEIADFEQSIQNLKFCINHNKNFTEAYYYLGINYSSLNKKTEARINFNIALSLYLRGFKNKNPYNEVFMELYLSDIKEKLDCLS